MVQLVPLAQTAQDRDSVLHGRLRDVHLLEPALESGVLLDVLPVLVESRRADAPELAARQHGLEQVSRVHPPAGAPGAAGTHHRVDLVDEQNHAAVRVRHLLHHRLQPVLELAPELRAGDEEPHVEAHHANTLQRRGDVPRDDALRQTLDDRGFAHPGLADQHRVVLAAPRQNLHRAPDLVVAAHNRVELSLARLVRQVARVPVERLVLALGALVRHHVPAAQLHDRRLQTGGVHADVRAQRRAEAVVRGGGEHQVLDGDEVVPHLRLLPPRVVHQGLEVSSEHLLRATAHLRLPVDEAIDEARGGDRVGARLSHDAHRERILLLEERLAQVFRLHDLLLRVGRDLGREHDGLPGALGELVLRNLLLRAAVGAGRAGAAARRRAGDARRRGERPRGGGSPANGGRAGKRHGRRRLARHHRRHRERERLERRGGGRRERGTGEACGRELWRRGGPSSRPRFFPSRFRGKNSKSGKVQGG